MIKHIVGVTIGSYGFDPTTNQIYLIGLPPINQENLVLITNVTSGSIIYNFADPLSNGTMYNNVITLETDCSQFSPIDNLQIIIDLPDAVYSLSSAESPKTDDDNLLDVNDQIPMSIMPHLQGQWPVSVAMPVALGNEQIFDFQGPIISGSSYAIGNVLTIQDCLRYRSVALQVWTGVGCTGTLTFEGSNGLDNSSNWAALTLFDITSSTPVGATTITLAASTNRYFTGPISFRYFRVRVSTAVVGAIGCSVVYRMTPFAYPPFSGYAGTNIAQLSGTTTVAAGLAGTLAVGGSSASGTLMGMNPLVSGGVDYSGFIRRIITDSQGQIAQVGPDVTRMAGSNPVRTKEVESSLASWNPSELLELILQELKLISFYVKEMPWVMNQPAGMFKEDITDFQESSDKINWK
jgi:hypothetical protein